MMPRLLKNLLLGTTLCLPAAIAMAGGIDRSGQGLGALFEQGHYVDISYAWARPDVRGKDVMKGRTSDVTGDYGLVSASAKFDVTPNLSAALVFDRPWGGDLLYGTSSPLLARTRVDVKADAVLGLARYRFNEQFSLHGGLRVQRAEGLVGLGGLAYGAVNGYQVRLGPDTATGWVGGAAFEIPDIALRIAATYHQRIEHELKTVETGPLPPLAGRSVTRVSTPRTVNLDFQTGIATDTLLFGQLRWVNWSEFRVDPTHFMAVTGVGLIELDDLRTYALGVGRKLGDRWSAALTWHYEPRGGHFNSPLSPVSGRRGVTLAIRHQIGKMEVSAGINYLKLGDARLETGTPDTQRATMSGNDSLGVGIKLGYRL